jgi:uncharacterized protein (DUF2461 family)
VTADRDALARTQKAITELIEAVDAAFESMGTLYRGDWDRIKIRLAKEINP